VPGALALVDQAGDGAVLVDQVVRRNFGRRVFQALQRGAALCIPV
jgi:hypothetical protein